MKKVVCTLALALGLLGLIGCGGGGGAPVLETDSTLSAEEQADLRRTLIGRTWGVEFVTPTPNMQNREEKKNQLKWHFNADGTVRMTVVMNLPMAPEQEKSARMNWTLENRELTFSGGDSHERFRILDWSDERMMWLNYEGDNYFVLYPLE